jgi:hypothetical protein
VPVAESDVGELDAACHTRVKRHVPRSRDRKKQEMPAVRFQPRKARKPMLKSSPQNARAVSLNLWPLGFTCPAGHDAEALSNLGAMAKARFGMRKALGDCQTILQVFSLLPRSFLLNLSLPTKVNVSAFHTNSLYCPASKATFVASRHISFSFLALVTSKLQSPHSLAQSCVLKSKCSQKS